MPRDRQPEQPGRNTPYFFLSYARTPRPDPNDRYDPDRWVFRLYRDLSETIYHLTNAKQGSAGFMDREARPGDEWPRELAEALATCRVFVPLYSPRYFDSENCGKEWFAFARRALNQRARDAQNITAIVPALWVTVDQEKLPDVAKMIQFSHHEFGNRYGSEGFYGIMKIGRYRPDYHLAVHQLARRIVEVADQTRLGIEAPVDYMSLESAFGLDGIARRPRHQMQLTVVAPDTSKLPDGRGPYYYGRSPRDWSPYRPEISQPLADYAAELATCLGFKPTVSEIDERAAAGDTEPVAPGLYLVDAWATQSPQHREWLQRVDARHQPWTSVLLPWNHDDTETAGAEQRLRDGLEQCMSRKLASIPHQCRAPAVGIPTLKEFGDLLAPMAMAMLARYLKHAPAYPPEGFLTERPRLLPPDQDDSGEER